jgi:chemotaxis signal transduction protein
MSNSLAKNTEVEQILDRRAKKAALLETDNAEKTLVASVAVALVGNERFGIPMEGLALICHTPPIAHLPMIPPTICGVVQIRGEVMGAIDLARWFGIAAPATSRLLAVVEGPPGRLGLLIDSIQGFQDVTTDDLVETFCDDSQSTGHPVQFTTKDLVAILDLHQLFQCPEVAVDFTEKSKTTKEGAK